MKKNVVFTLLVISSIMALILPKPINAVIPLLILIPLIIYLIVNIVKYGKKW